MVSTELGACEWFVWDLRRSNLIERGQLEQIVSDFLAKHPRAEPNELADNLVESGILTRFQADRLLAGKTQGFVLGPFTLLDALGSGSMGTVYKAVNKNDNKEYAVKVLPRRSMWNIRIARRKVRDFEQIEHPSVVPFVDVGTAGGLHYLAWPLVTGEPLDKLVERKGKLSPSEAASYAIQTAEGLDATHQKGIIHGLLKPSNLLIGADGEVKILDFGIGSLLAETEDESVVDTMSQANTMVSGLVCAAPESIEDPNKLSPLADQYSLGCTLYYCLTGSYPFPGNNAVEIMMAHQTKQPISIKSVNPEVPDELVKVVDRLMQKDPATRYPSVQDALVALRPFSDRKSASAESPSSTADLVRRLRKQAASKATPPPEEDEGQLEALVDEPAPPPPRPVRQPPMRPTPPEGPRMTPARTSRPTPSPDEAPHRMSPAAPRPVVPPPKGQSGFIPPPRPASRPIEPPKYEDFTDTGEKKVPVVVALGIMVAVLGAVYLGAAVFLKLWPFQQ